MIDRKCYLNNEIHTCGKFIYSNVPGAQQALRTWNHEPFLLFILDYIPLSNIFLLIFIQLYDYSRLVHIVPVTIMTGNTPNSTVARHHVYFVYY